MDALFFPARANVRFIDWVNYSASKDIPFGEMQWRLPLIMQSVPILFLSLSACALSLIHHHQRLIPGILFVVAMLFQPESPRWLVEHQQYEQAAIVLGRNTGKTSDNPRVLETLEEIKKDFLGQDKLSIIQQVVRFGESRPIALRCFIAPLVAFFQQVRVGHFFGGEISLKKKWTVDWNKCY